MKISIVVAMAENSVIGIENRLPWHLPADLAHFKAVTMGKPILMGRKTYESIGRPLPGRTNIVVSRNIELEAPGCVVVDSIEAALAEAQQETPDEIMIIGGAYFYQQMLAAADRIYLTRVHCNIEGDAHFPELGAEWRECSREDHQADTNNDHDYSFLVLER
ncbi:MAG: type 3 dihydrofolate reductase [Gammaproteobacteria bacterium]|nr:type 3 dihydrofolate reductase [Gammaproteobacteria bacterium]